MTSAGFLQGTGQVRVGAGVPTRIRGGTPSVTDDPRTFFAPYAELLRGHFDTLRPPTHGETQEAYLDEHLGLLGRLCAWPARAELHDARDLVADRQDDPDLTDDSDLTDDLTDDSTAEQPGERHQVLVVYDDSANVVDACAAMMTLDRWHPHLLGSLIAALQRSVRSVAVWGPNETLDTMFCWGDQAQFWENVRFEAWQALHPDEKVDSLPRHKGQPVIPVTREELRAYVRREKIRTPGQIRRRIGRATCAAARFPLSDEQLRAVATHPSTSDVQREALTRFLDGLDELRAAEQHLLEWDDDELFTALSDQDTYMHAQIVIDTDPDPHSAVIEAYEDYERFQMHAGTSEYPSFVGSLNVTTDLEDVLLALGQLHEVLVRVCVQLRDWPQDGVTPEMRAAHRDLKPDGPQMYTSVL